VSFEQQLEKVRTKPGFIAALDQSGGSTPKALGLYGINEDAWSNDDEMFAIVHEMRTRIITSPAFSGNRILGAILFENTMDREIEGQPTARAMNIFRECFDNGVIIRTTGDTLAFSPPLIIDEAQIEIVVESVRKALHNN